MSQILIIVICAFSVTSKNINKISIFKSRWERSTDDEVGALRYRMNW